MLADFNCVDSLQLMSTIVADHPSLNVLWTFVLPGDVEVLRPITELPPAWERVVVVCCVQLSSRLEARWLRRLAVLKLTVNHHEGSRLSVLQLFENADVVARAERDHHLAILPTAPRAGAPKLRVFVGSERRSLIQTQQHPPLDPLSTVQLDRVFNDIMRETF